MDFVSDIAWLFDEPEYEDISDDEFENGMEISDSGESDQDETTPRTIDAGTNTDITTVGRAQKKQIRQLVGKWRQKTFGDAQQQRSMQASNARRCRRADTNILSIKGEKLVSHGNIQSGDTIYCKSCHSVLSNKSSVNGKVWECEFCNVQNTVNIDEKDLPKNDELTFILEPAESPTPVTVELDDTLIVFCIDISGSMCVTSEVPGRMKLRGGMERLASEELFDQYMPEENRDITYVSRLQAAQAAVDHQLSEMSKQHPNRRVALVTFNSQVHVIGDGTGSSNTISGYTLTDMNLLLATGRDSHLPKPISETKDKLSDKVFELEEGETTALGPALLVAISMASKRPRSKVILCTDGRANVGLGKLDELKTEEDEANARQFYEDAGHLAVLSGVTISVISIKGTDCKMVHLGKLADITGGKVNVVNPATLTDEFTNILAEPVIATNAMVTLVLPDMLCTYDEYYQETSILAKRIGNITESTEVTFEYTCKLKSKEQLQLMEQESQSKDKTLPFQIQVLYTALNGAKVLRVFTERKPYTRDRRLAERRINLELLGQHTATVTAQLAMEGRYTESRIKAMMSQRLASRYTRTSEEGRQQRKRYRRMFGKIKSIENQLNIAQKQEKLQHGHTYSDDEDDIGESSSSTTGVKRLQSLKRKLNQRQAQCSDETAAMIFQCKSSRFLKEC